VHNVRARIEELAVHKQQVGILAVLQSLRGSGDFWALGDSNLYLRHAKEQLILSMEHRAAAPPDPVSLQLAATDETAVHLEVIGTLRSEKQERGATLANAVLSALAAAPALTRGQLRDKLSVKNQRLGRVLLKLEAEGAIARTAEGWQTAAAVPDLRWLCHSLLLCCSESS